MGTRTLRLITLASTALALLGWACSDDPKRPPVLGQEPAQPGLGSSTGSANGGVEGGADDAGDAGDSSSCTDLVNTSVEVAENAVLDALPQGAGGTVTDGVYELAEARVYDDQGGGLPGPTGASFQVTIRLTGQVFERVALLRSSGGAVTEIRSSGTFTPSGTSGTIALSCPTPSQEQVTYTATSESITLSNLATKESFLFARKP